MADAYATRADVFKYGLPRGAMGNQSRLVESASTSDDSFELEGHGFETDDRLAFRAVEGGSLPSPLAAGTTYYAIRVSDSLFKVAASAGGAAVNLTTAGSQFVVTADLPFDEILEFYSRWVDGVIPHLAPLESPYPKIVTGIVAMLAAKRLQEISGVLSESMGAVETGAKAQLERWAKGAVIRDGKATASSNLAISRPVRATDGRGWGSGSLP